MSSLHSHHHPLRGSCMCGRNQFTIALPQNFAQETEVFFSNSFEHRHTLAAPLTAWLRIPLTWYNSTTYPFYPDETYASIRRTFTPHTAPATKRVFCGYCGTNLTYWTEQPREEADFVCVTVGSLGDEEVEALEEGGVLPGEIETETPLPPQPSSSPLRSRDISDHNHDASTIRSSSGLPWFADLTRGSRLNDLLLAHNVRTRTRRGGAVSADGTTSIEWEITEVSEAPEAGEVESPGKRRRGAPSAGEDFGDSVTNKADDDNGEDLDVDVRMSGAL
ncbi:MAG: hypothetical protein M1834_005898 [Cirrosporium novae-zelandiae]|nr:MAG: hypothetical protein M1834_005898 [Cirrosporium novae-zelandiae]